MFKGLGLPAHISVSVFVEARCWSDKAFLTSSALWRPQPELNPIDLEHSTMGSTSGWV